MRTVGAAAACAPSRCHLGEFQFYLWMPPGTRGVVSYVGAGGCQTKEPEAVRRMCTAANIAAGWCRAEVHVYRWHAAVAQAPTNNYGTACDFTLSSLTFPLLPTHLQFPLVQREQVHVILQQRQLRRQVCRPVVHFARPGRRMP